VRCPGARLRTSEGQTGGETADAVGMIEGLYQMASLILIISRKNCIRILIHFFVALERSASLVILQQDSP
jgi:hypothetical protein